MHLAEAVVPADRMAWPFPEKKMPAAELTMAAADMIVLAVAGACASLQVAPRELAFEGAAVRFVPIEMYSQVLGGLLGVLLAVVHAPADAADAAENNLVLHQKDVEAWQDADSKNSAVGVPRFLEHQEHHWMLLRMVPAGGVVAEIAAAVLDGSWRAADAAGTAAAGTAAAVAAAAAGTAAAAAGTADHSHHIQVDRRLDASQKVAKNCSLGRGVGVAVAAEVAAAGGTDGCDVGLMSFLGEDPKRSLLAVTYQEAPCRAAYRAVPCLLRFHPLDCSQRILVGLFQVARGQGG